MSVQAVSMPMGAFLGGVVSKYIWVRPELNFAGLKTLGWGGACGVGTLIVAHNLAIPLLGHFFPGTPAKGKQAEKPSEIALLITALAWAGVTELISRQFGEGDNLKETANLALLSTTGAIIADKVFGS